MRGGYGQNILYRCMEFSKNRLYSSKAGAGEMTWELRALVALTEDLCSIPRTHKAAHNCL